MLLTYLQQLQVASPMTFLYRKSKAESGGPILYSAKQSRKRPRENKSSSGVTKPKKRCRQNPVDRQSVRTTWPEEPVSKLRGGWLPKHAETILRQEYPMSQVQRVDSLTVATSRQKHRQRLFGSVEHGAPCSIFISERVRMLQLYNLYFIA